MKLPPDFRDLLEEFDRAGVRELRIALLILPGHQRRAQVMSTTERALCPPSNARARRQQRRRAASAPPLDAVDCDAIIDCMASLTIRDLEVTTKERLRVRAALHKRSMEEEARTILRAAVAEDDAVKNLAEAIRERFRPLGGVELSPPPREPIRDSPQVAPTRRTPKSRR